jgi:tRNA modification GTPase
LRQHRAVIEQHAPDLKTGAELRAGDVRLAARALGRFSGRVGVKDLLDVIFRDFYVRK